MTRRRTRHVRRHHREAGYDRIERDRNGCPVERLWIEGNEVIVRYDDVPAKDITTVDGIPCTTPLRTVIDLAAEMDDAELEAMVQDCLDRRLFSLDDAMARVAEDDIRHRPGAVRLRSLLERQRPDSAPEHGDTS